MMKRKKVKIKIYKTKIKTFINNFNIFRTLMRSFSKIVTYLTIYLKLFRLDFYEISLIIFSLKAMKYIVIQNHLKLG